MNLKYGIVALSFFLIGLAVGYKCTRFDEMKYLADTCVAQQESQVALTKSYKQALHMCLEPFNKRGKR